MDKLILSQIPVDELKSAISEVIRTEFQKFTSTEVPEVKTEYITRQETAKILGISLPTLHEWSNKGIIPRYKVATRIRYKREDVINSLNKVLINRRRD